MGGGTRSLGGPDTRKENRTQESDQTHRLRTVVSAALPPRNAPDESFNPRERSWTRVCAMRACIRDFLKVPPIGRHRSDGSINRFKVRLRTLHDFFRRQRIDWIE